MKIFKLISLCLITTLITNTPNANCDSSSSFGIGITLGTHNNNVKCSLDNLNTLLVDKIKQSIANTQKKLVTPNTTDTPMIDDQDNIYTLNAYTSADQQNIDGATDSSTLPEKPKVLDLKLKKFNSENPTKYRLYSYNPEDPT
ncbi:MAG: hypothetical protein IJ848_04290 [Alphaproteobacteria bacterium]|nr:hypothetical protein [Alphaproteobacteria bacterium]